MLAAHAYGLKANLPTYPYKNIHRKSIDLAAQNLGIYPSIPPPSPLSLDQVVTDSFPCEAEQGSTARSTLT